MSHHDPNVRSPARPNAIVLAAALALTLAACGGGGPGGGGTATGTLDVDVTGLPAGTAAAVAVTGPGGFSDALTGDETLSDLTVGTYTVAAQPVDAPTPAGATYDPIVPSQSAAVVAGATTDVTVEYDLHECVMYEPTPTIPVDISGQWEATDQAGQVVEIITAPDDPGGGYVTVRLQSTASMRPQLFAEVVPAASGAINLSGQTATDPAINPDPTLVEAVFEVAPDRSYQLILRGLNAGGMSTTLPQPFTASWSFTSRVDCYEPNDTPETAKAIPLENPISATFIAGFRDSNSIVSASEPTLDLYRFELHAPSAVRITLSDVADEVRPRLIVYDEGGTQIGSGALAPAAGENAVYESTGALPAGWYRVRVDTAMGGGRRSSLISNTDRVIPPHFLQDYTLVVEALD
ncbi:MAG: hypothetical protein K0A98_11045 [Trueperaceae bacterium]|nr:hypothetical protein [Trueperaceae bacterium]